jgi:hypothetical protein
VPFLVGEQPQVVSLRRAAVLRHPVGEDDDTSFGEIMSWWRWRLAGVAASHLLMFPFGFNASIAFWVARN